MKRKTLFILFIIIVCVELGIIYARNQYYDRMFTPLPECSYDCDDIEDVTDDVDPSDTTLATTPSSTTSSSSSSSTSSYSHSVNFDTATSKVLKMARATPTTVATTPVPVEVVTTTAATNTATQKPRKTTNGKTMAAIHMKNNT